MILRQIEVHRNGEHVANFPIQEFDRLANQFACIRPVGNCSVPMEIQFEISKHLRRGWTSARCRNGFSWNIKKD